MKALRLPALIAAMSAPLLLAASAADANPPFSGFTILPPPPPGPVGHPNMHGFHGGFVVVERDYVPVIEREVVREVPAAPPAPPAPPPPPRKPYVIGRSYASLPGACMKMIEGGASYYYCSGLWYRQVGDGRAAQYKAVAQP